ncbi:hypothetical protein K7432_014051, partial [Basidiobolus ranarum]
KVTPPPCPTPPLGTLSPAPPTGPKNVAPPHENADSKHGSGISTGAIIGIALGSVALVTLVACLIFILHRRKRTKSKQMVETKRSQDPGNPSPNQYNLRPATSSTLRSTRSESEVDSITPLSASNSTARRNSLRLTVKDAQLLAHTYRAMLSNNNMNGEDVPQTNQRSLYSDELLKRELAAEGRGVKNVSTSPAIVVVNSDQIGRNSMTADHSEHSETNE